MRIHLIVFIAFTAIPMTISCTPTGDVDAGDVDAGDVDAGGVDGGVTALCDEVPPGLNYEHEIFRFETDPAGVELILTRDYVEAGVGESVIYGLSRISLTTDSAVCITDDVALDYENSHHNWRDTAFFTVDDINYTFTLSYTFPDDINADAKWEYILTGRDQADAVVDGPHVLIALEGPSQYMIDFQ